VGRTQRKKEEKGGFAKAIKNWKEGTQEEKTKTPREKTGGNRPRACLTKTRGGERGGGNDWKDKTVVIEGKTSWKEGGLKPITLGGGRER